MTDAEIFSRARRASDRSACTRWLQAKGVKPGDPSRQTEVEAHRRLPILLDPDLVRICRRIVISSLGPESTSDTPFKYVLWKGGVTDVEDGDAVESTLEGFVGLLELRAQETAQKRKGWVVTPTTNPNGYRGNKAVESLHALFLDCDGSGSFTVLKAVLSAVGLAHVLYESGGSTPETPKWRCVLPLARPFSVPDEARRALWKSAYADARVIFGALGGLRGVGFDPATDPPTNPWFLTERRSPDDELRRVVWSPGKSLDLDALVAAYPSAPLITEPKTRTTHVRVSRSLSPETQAALVDRLAEATASVPAGRHELYLALSGVLLDRGVDSDDVYDIIEEVSERYPRAHPEHHADNLHGAETTIKKFLRGENYTRIGTLAERWPEVARAVDAALPDPLVQSARKFLASLSGETSPVGDATQQQQPAPSTPSGQAEAWDVAKVKTKIAALQRKKFKAGAEYEDEGEAIKGVLLRRFVNGDKLTDDEDPDALRDLAPEQAVAKVGGMLAYALPLGVPSGIIVKIGWVSLSKMVSDEATLGDFTAWLQVTYERGVGTRLAEEAAAQEKEMQRRARVKAAMYSRGK